MKASPMIACLATILLCAEAYAAETAISSGNTPEQVLRTAGEPIGRMNHGNRVVWLYRQGDVTFIDNKVVEFSWLTDEQLADRTRVRQERERASTAADRKAAEAAAQKAAAPPPTHPKADGAPANRKQYIYRPTFTRNPSASARYIGAIPVEFEQILLPKVWVRDGNVQVGRYTGKSRRRALAGISAALARYPTVLTEKTLNTIYMPSYLVMAGDKAGGIADFAARSVCITSSQDFHHEFAHILHYSFWKLFPEKEWMALNGKSYTDDGRIVRTNHDPRQTYGSPWYHDQGFVNRYAMVSVFEDFAETFGIAFGTPEVMDRIQRNSKPIAAKLDLLVRFLNEVIRVTSGQESHIEVKDILTPAVPQPASAAAQSP